MADLASIDPIIAHWGRFSSTPAVDPHWEAAKRTLTLVPFPSRRLLPEYHNSCIPSCPIQIIRDLLLCSSFLSGLFSRVYAGKLKKQCSRSPSVHILSFCRRARALPILPTPFSWLRLPRATHGFLIAVQQQLYLIDQLAEF